MPHSFNAFKRAVALNGSKSTTAGPTSTAPAMASARGLRFLKKAGAARDVRIVAEKWMEG